MATVELRFSALPAHVRTARLVAAAVARRSGVDEAVLDEVRLAVGEACSRAVAPAPPALPRRPGQGRRWSTTRRPFSVAVTDEAPTDQREDEAALADLAASAAEAADPDRGRRARRVSASRVIAGLVDDVAGRARRATGGARRDA